MFSRFFIVQFIHFYFCIPYCYWYCSHFAHYWYHRNHITVFPGIERLRIVFPWGHACHPTKRTNEATAQIHMHIITPWHDDVIKWKTFPRYWPFVWGIHRWPVNSPHIGQWRGALMFSLTCAWINRWVNNRDAGDFRHHRDHYDVTAMKTHK